MKNHTPQRMCVACRQMKPKDELIRMVVSDNKAVIDSNMKIQSRGAYVCKNKDCVAVARKKRCLERSLKIDCTGVHELLEKFISEDSEV